MSIVGASTGLFEDRRVWRRSIRTGLTPDRSRSAGPWCLVVRDAGSNAMVVLDMDVGSTRYALKEISQTFASVREFAAMTIWLAVSDWPHAQGAAQHKGGASAA